MSSTTLPDEYITSFRGDGASSNATFGTDYNETRGEGLSTKHIVVPAERAQNLANYLAMRPYKEVADFMNWILRTPYLTDHRPEDGAQRAKTHIALPHDLAQSLANYLAERPYSEVAEFLNWVRRTEFRANSPVIANSQQVSQ